MINECLHRRLRCFFKGKTSISPRVMVALLHSYFYTWNSRLSGINSLESSLQACLNKSAQDESHLRPIFGLPLDNTTKTMDHGHCLVPENELADIAQKATDLFYASEKMPKIATLAIEDQVLGCEFSAKPACNSESDMHEHYKLVDGWLTDAKLKRIPMPSDGNCLFSAIAYLLKNSQLSQKYMDFLTSINVDTTSEIEVLAMFLRKCSVADLQENYNHYRGYLNQMTYEEYMEELDEFKNEGCFAGELGDMQVIALANALRTNIHFVSSSYKQPFQHINPRDSVLNEQPLCVVFICYGPGHYDAAMLQKVTEPNKKTKKCRCGRKANAPCATRLCTCVANKVSCGTDPCCGCNNCQNKYGTRASTPTKRRFCACGKNIKEEPSKKVCSSSKCPCFIKGRACEACTCKFCANKYGKSENKVTKGTRSVTDKTMMAKHGKKFERSSSSQFLTDNDFALKPLRWSLKEAILLQKVISYKNLKEPYDMTEITLIFNSIIKKCPNIGLIKTEEQIRAKLSHIKKIITGK